jgi:carboxypeptidase Taq
MPAVASSQLTELAERVAEVIDLHQVAALVEWDQETMMPPRGAIFRATQQAALHGVIHEKLTNPRIGELLSQLEEPGELHGLTEVQQAIVREVRRDYDRATKLPASLVRELALTVTEALETWREARQLSSWGMFAPKLARIVELKRQQASCYGYTDSPYDALLDEYEPGATTAQLRRLFTDLRAATVALLNRIAAAPRQLDRGPFERPYDLGQQAAFTEQILRDVGFDFSAGRQDRSTHPFSTSFGPTDVRLTTRYDANDLAVALYASIHEGGHGLYELGLPVDLARSGVGEAASLGIHESQSRMYENFIGRSLPFWRFAFPKFRQYFPAQTGDLSPEKLVAAANRVERSLVRVEADEVTYNLHIILRFEIEQRLITGQVGVDDLPALWNQLMTDYLGVAPPNDRLGVLQDTHWAGGSIGYFPTYSLGNVYAAQLWHALRRQLPDLDRDIGSGNFAEILRWLRENIHQYGRIYRPAELIKRATGEEPNPSYLIQYLNDKYGALYGV